MEQKVLVARPHVVGGFSPPGIANCWPELLSSNRFALGMALFLAVVLPELVHPYVSGFGSWFSTGLGGVEPSLVGTSAAIIAGHLSLRKIGVLPLVSTRAIIFPTFIATFGVVALVLFSFRLQFGRYHLWTGLTIVLMWYLALSVLRSGYLRPVIGLLGALEGLPSKLPAGIEWRLLDGTGLPCRVAAVVVDPHADLTVNNARFITQLVLDGTPVYHLEHCEEGLTGKVRFHSHADNNFGALLPSLTYLRVKRLIDIAGAVVLLLPAMVIMALAGIAIKLTSHGPVVFSQTRTGYRGRPFTCYKLRTMAVEHNGPAFTSVADPRITAVGRLLRKWRIDELPQIVNVLKGEMSWIGPRPEAEVLAIHYSANVPFYDYRHAVRPGISGWAAVHQGNVANVSAAQEKLEYDFYYIKYFSFWLDCLIALKTCKTIVSGFGSR